MSMSRLPNILKKLLSSYFFKLLFVSIVVFVMVFCMLESKDGDISFVYNNF